METEVNSFITKTKTITPGDFINEVVEKLGLPIYDTFVDNKYVAYFRGDNKLIYKVNFKDSRVVKIMESDQ